jgi:hypothetical protein
MLQDDERLSRLWRYVFVQLLDDYESSGATCLQCSSRPISASACRVGSPPVRLTERALAGSRLTTFLARSKSHESSRSSGGWEHMRQ